MKRPTKEALHAAYGKRILDVIAADLKVLFCGINPSLYSGATGHHFVRPGNRFWPVLHRADFTDRVLDPSEEKELLLYGLGVTNLVNRATANAAELGDDELRVGARRLRAKVGRNRPGWVAFVGIGAYRVALGRPEAQVGPQEEAIGSARIWVLPNTSGLNAHYQLPELTREFRRLKRVALK